MSFSNLDLMFNDSLTLHFQRFLVLLDKNNPLPPSGTKKENFVH